MKKLALINHHKACKLADELAKIKGVKVLNKNFFNEFTIELNQDSKEVNKKLLEKRIIGGRALENNKMVVAVTELTTDKDIGKFAAALKEIL